MIYLSFFSHLNLAFLQKNEKKKMKDKKKQNKKKWNKYWHNLETKKISPKPYINRHWRPDYHAWSIFKNEENKRKEKRTSNPIT